MYTLLLVDDEEEVIEAIVKKVKWEELGFQVTGHANNGFKAMDMLEEMQPDVVMTDIRMPYMDGLELCAHIKAKYPATKILLFTGFDDFEYAKEAVHLEIEEYILKPLNAVEITEVFERLKEKLDYEISEKRNTDLLKKYYADSLPMLQANLYTTLIEGRIPEEEMPHYFKDYQIAFTGPWYCCLIIHTSASQVPEGMDIRLLSVSVDRQAGENLGEKWNAKRFRYLGDTIMIMQLKSEEEISELTDACDRFCKYIHHIMGAKVTIGIGQVCGHIAKIAASYQSAREAVSYRVLYGSNRAINLKEIVPQRKIQRDAGEKTELSNVFKKICLGENEDIANAIEVYMQHNFLDLKSLEKYHVAVMELIGELYHFMVNNEMDTTKIPGGISSLYNELCNLEPQVFIHKGLNLLYEANKENLRSIAIYNGYGSLMAAEPVVAQKEEPDVTRQGWFMQAKTRMENIHFSTPHVQNLFDDGTCRYYWVISSSRVVELTNGTDTQLGVLLVDMDYSGISRMMERINTSGKGQYFYLCDGEGNIIYHPHQARIDNGMNTESSVKAASSKEKIYDEYLGKNHRKVMVGAISYTGWRLVCVMPYEIFTNKMADVKQFVLLILLLMAMMLVFVNRIISVRISRPIMKLDHSVREYQEGKEEKIAIGGSTEIRHLGQSIQESYRQNSELMKKVIWEQNERRKSEFDVLQSQINPHFLYNTLDSITWMIESGKNEEAAFMITQLAKLFRISLSKGHTVIRIRDELQHAQSYVNIQKVRYKNKFEVVFDIRPDILDDCIVKLVLQPILENAINYGVREMDDCGKILIRGWKEQENIFMQVSDNGMGIPEEEIDLLLKDTNRVHKKGSGVGLVNVNNRLRLLFGEPYGLQIESELDEGTTVTVIIPEIVYSEENCRKFEEHHMPEDS